MFTVAIEAQTAQELKDAVAALHAELVGGAVPEVHQPQTPQPAPAPAPPVAQEVSEDEDVISVAEMKTSKRGRKPKPQVEDDMEFLGEEPVEAAPAPTSEDVKQALIKFHKANGKEASVALLGKFGAATVSQLSPAKYREFIEVCKG